jgi:hypothetical protein
VQHLRDFEEVGMIARLVPLLLAGALALPAAAASQPPAAPADPAALDLARLIMGRDPSLYEDADLSRFRARLANALLGSEGTCNPRLTECQAAADAVAAQFAPALRRVQRERSEQLTASLVGHSLRPDEVAHVSAWLRSDEGRRFLELWTALRDPDRSAERRLLSGDLDRLAADVIGPARALFRQRSRDLPQPAPR